MPLFLFIGCGDLEPEMQDTRTVILNMDFDQRSSSRTSRVEQDELINYKTHLIMALTSEKNLSNSNYWDYKDSNQEEYVLYDLDRKITLKMKVNAKMKIFAFLFMENYSCSRCITGNRSGLHDDLFDDIREAGYYGESQIITINSQTANIPLKPVPGANTDTFTELEGTWETACYTNSDNTSAIETITMVGNILTLKDEKHSDTSCATDYSLTESSHTFSIGDPVTFSEEKTGHEFTVTIGSTEKITPQSASTVSSYNSRIKCGASDWELNTEKECSIDNASETIYCLYQLDGNNFYPDCNDSSYPSTSDIDTSDASSTFVKQ